MPKNRMLVAAACALAFIAGSIALFNYSSSLKREVTDLKARQKELIALKDEYQSLKGRVDTVEGKKSLTKVEGIVSAVDEVFQSIGLKQSLKSVKPTAQRELADSVEEEAEIQIEKVGMNEMVNIFHKFDTAPMLITVKKTTIKTSFDNPSLLNITITASLIKPK
ncbi:MAG: hypothetical protein Q8J64_06090 [Thermodesulfovibrionales bacterium]|nr:hypothetical protein [Thermodesulfovibrionales bacterium]